MARETLADYRPEALLEELRAREIEAGKTPSLARSLTACRRPRRAPVSRGCVDETPLRRQLRRFDTKEIIGVVRSQQKVVYGVDNRMDLYEVTDPAILADAASVVSIVSESGLSDNGDGTWTLSGPTFQSDYSLCDSEPFGSQPTVAFCTGFLVDPSLIVTAGHCIQDGNLATSRFVFGFEMEDGTTPRTVIPEADVCRGHRIIGRQQMSGGPDWAVVQLDRAILHRPFVRIRRQGVVGDGQALHVIGHPTGLPMKYAPDAVVRENDASAYFVANLDTYGGNSGSPVFNSSTHDVEGVLVRGETDFVYDGGCYVSNVCPVNGCQGEDCTRTAEFAHLVPENQLDCINFDPDAAQVVQVNGRWKIVVGPMLLKDFAASKDEAVQSLSIIKHYGLNAQCFVGRSHGSVAMEFYLSNGQAPEGPMPGDDCIGFDPAALEVDHVQGRWKIVEEDHWLMDFDQSEADARQALSFILRFGFRYIGFVGRPGPSMTYFRR